MAKILLLGYGHSGVSFLRDFLSEIENNYTFPWEFWITCFAGGIFDLANTVEENSNALDDSSIRRFFKLVDYLYDNKTYSPLFGEDFMKYSKEFANKLIITKSNSDIMWCDMHEQIKFPKLKFLPKPLRKYGAKYIHEPIRELNNDYGMYFLNTMHHSEYVEIAKRYLEQIYSMFPSKQYLTLVHPLMVSSKYDKQLEYFDAEDKVIRISRDPRDVYVNLKRDIGDMSIATSVDCFIKYFKKRRFNDEHNEKFKNGKLLDVKFENFVLNYDETRKIILDFCKIPLKYHTKIKEKANPAVSNKNIGLYKTYDKQDEIKLIEKELAKYCWGS